MSKLLVAIVASTFALGTVSSYAKTEELTKEQRAELRQRADRLIEERAAHPAPAKEKAAAKHAPKTKKHPATKEQPKT